MNLAPAYLSDLCAAMPTTGLLPQLHFSFCSGINIRLSLPQNLCTCLEHPTPQVTEWLLFFFQVSAEKSLPYRTLHSIVKTPTVLLNFLMFYLSAVFLSQNRSFKRQRSQLSYSQCPERCLALERELSHYLLNK